MMGFRILIILFTFLTAVGSRANENGEVEGLINLYKQQYKQISEYEKAHDTENSKKLREKHITLAVKIARILLSSDKSEANSYYVLAGMHSASLGNYTKALEIAKERVSYMPTNENIAALSFLYEGISCDYSNYANQCRSIINKQQAKQQKERIYHNGVYNGERDDQFYMSVFSLFVNAKQEKDYPKVKQYARILADLSDEEIARVEKTNNYSLLYSRASAQGILAGMYFDGMAVPQSYKKALLYSKKGWMTRGNYMSGIVYSVLLYEGLGTRQNRTKAKEIMGNICDSIYDGSEFACKIYNTRMVRNRSLKGLKFYGDFYWRN